MSEIANYFRLNIVKMKEVKIRGWYRARSTPYGTVLFVFIYTKLVIGQENRPFVQK